jgi:hypothetical protein
MARAHLLRLLWTGCAAFVACAGLSSVPAGAVTFTCPLDAFTLYRDPGSVGTLVILVPDGSPATIQLQGLWGNIALPVSKLLRQGQALVVQGAGPAQLAMPDREKFDACLERKLQADPRLLKSRHDAKAIADCKQEAGLTTQPVAVNLALALATVAPPRAQAMIDRTYADETGDTARLHGVETMASCTAQP